MKMKVTYTTTYTTEIECSGMGNDNYPRCFENKTPSESDLIAMVQKIETANAEDVVQHYMDNGGAVTVVTVEKIS